ncbi:dynamin family protein [Mangrovibacter yixingensis]|uniref:dynamin family protein n=1 Tax=Mangrovibacter yixingensis TaxID=1529639 RepID=UPI001CFE7334|nr:dynamin family protein [Mangrovibacter yixingensis]
MHTQTIFELSQEAERLLQLAISQLDSIQQFSTSSPPVKATGSTVEANANHFSLNGIQRQHEILQSELRKLTHQEMVLAIVGTMKAGKSTTINAIIGTEVLPNRNRPMTALPTLIRHTPGQKEPRLYFPHVLPIEALMENLHAVLVHCDRELLAERLEIDNDMEALIQRIIEKQGFERHYLGAQPIFYCLKSLNDLVRLSQVLNVDFPFAAYTAIEHIPVIEVEFVHLAEQEVPYGQLTLLDTPGPNEAGQPYLQQMLKEQLSRASAVMVVLDYTQLKSVSDDEMRRVVAQVGDNVPLYALVNKFDQKDRNSDDEQQIRALIAGSLMRGVITPEHIFPVSSMWGYLAYRAKHEIEQHGCLPCPDQHRWVQDFADAALGRRWQASDLADIPHIQQAAQLLWEDAMLQSPISTILDAAQGKAALFALHSAVQKLHSYSRLASEFLSLRSQGLNMDNNSLQSHIQSLELDISTLYSCQAEVAQRVQVEMEAAIGQIGNHLDQCRLRVQSTLKTYFEKGVVPAMVTQKVCSLLYHEPDFPPGERLLVSGNENLARLSLFKISHSCEVIMTWAQGHMATTLAEIAEGLKQALTAIFLQTLKPIEQRLSARLDDCVKDPLPLPDFQHMLLDASVASCFADALTEQRAVNSPMQSGVRSAMLRWFNGATEQLEGNTDYSRQFAINLNELQTKLFQHISQSCEHMRGAVYAQLDVSVTQCLTTFFAEVTSSLEAIQRNLNHCMLARQQSNEQQQGLRKRVQHCLETASFIGEDTRLLQEDIQTLLKAEQ